MEILTLLILVCLFLIVFWVWYLLFAHTDVVLALTEKFGRPVSDLKGKVIWVTGSSAGLGEAMCYELASVGAKLVLTARNARRLQEVKERCLDLSKGKLQSDDILVVPFDITDLNIHEARATDVVKHFGKIDVLINNAGIIHLSMTADTDREVTNEMFDVNFFGTANLTKVVLSHFLETGKGHIVSISSMGAKCAIPGFSSYLASKTAIHGLYESMRTEYHHKNIRVTLVCPGMFESSLKFHLLTGRKGEVFKDPVHCETVMPTARCAHLALIAVANELSEAWISYQMGLFAMHCAQYCPDLMRFVLRKLFKPAVLQCMVQGKYPSGAVPAWKPVSG